MESYQRRKGILNNNNQNNIVLDAGIEIQRRSGSPAPVERIPIIDKKIVYK
jgi:hypothetical protein